MAVGLLMVVAWGRVAADAQPPPAGTEEPPAPLAVPYVAQSRLLCGGAAIAMVERWWGRRGVRAEDFSHLVRPEEGGIRTTDLIAAVRGRDWEVRVLQPTAAAAREVLRQGIPLVALIRVGRDRYHYVVVLSWGAGMVTFHDPAGAPSTMAEENRFLAQWDGADRWAVVFRPGPPSSRAEPMSGPTAVLDSMPCRPWIDQALTSTASGQYDEAVRLLERAGHVCPVEPLVHRELAGVRFKQERYGEAARLASTYLAITPDDSLGWQLLAASRFLAGDQDGALRAWNRLGRPVIDLVQIHGARNAPFRVLAGAMGLSDGQLLRPAGLALARRRIEAVPAVRRASVDYRPVGGGLVEVHARVVERATIDPLWRLVTGNAVRAIAEREVSLTAAGLFGRGELWAVGWRWDRARPRGVVRVDWPVGFVVPAVVTVHGSRERTRIAASVAGPSVEETRGSTALGLVSWISSAVRASIGMRLDHWSGHRRYLAASAGSDVKGWADRLAVSVSVGHAVGLSADAGYSDAAVRARWISSSGYERATWSARVGVDWVGAAAPYGAWPVIGGNQSAAIQLRAAPTGRHVLTLGQDLSRRVAHAGLSGDHPVARAGPLLFAAGVFLDGAHLAAPPGQSVGAWHLDGGIGVRIGLRGSRPSGVRIDLARGLLTGRRTALTITVHQPGPFPLGLR